jgi:MFS family permease
MRMMLPHRFSELGLPFQRLLWSDGLMLLSLMVGQVAVPWWIAQSGGAADLAVYGVVLSVVSFIAMPLLSPLGDRYPKRWLIAGALAAYALAACGTAALASWGHYALGALIALQSVPMLAMAVLSPASASMVAELVPATQLTRAIGVQQSAQSMGRLIGPAIGGTVLAAAGTAAALWLNGVLLVGAAALATRLPSQAAPSHDRAQRRWWPDLRAGLKANWAIPLERGWILVNFLSWIFLFPALAMLVPLKVQSLGLSAAWLGACEAALSLGMLVGSLGASEWWIRRQGRYATRITSAVVQGIALAVAGWTTWPWLLVPAFAVAGFTNSAATLVGLTHRMLARPVAFRARMSAGAMMTSQVAGTLGPALAGIALAHWPVSTVYGVFALLGGFGALGLTLIPGFREFMALDHDAVNGWYQRMHPQAFEDASPRSRP